MRRLELLLFAGEATQATSETVVVMVPSDERPLRGDAGRIDWRLDGRLSEQLQFGFASGVLGEAVLLPASLPLFASRVLMVGVGTRRRLDLEEGRPLMHAMRGAADRLISLRSGSALLAGSGSVDYDLDAYSLLRGLTHSLHAAPEPAQLRIILPRAETREAALRAGLAELAPSTRELGIKVEVRRIQNGGGQV